MSLDELLDKVDDLLYGRQPQEALTLILSVDTLKLTAEELCDYKTLLGETYSENNMTDKAIECFENVLSMQDVENKDEAICYDYLTDLMFDKGEYERSIDFGKKALALEKRRGFLIDLFLRLALSYKKLGNFRDAAQCYEKLLQDFYPPQDEDEKQQIFSVYNSLILTYWFLGEEEKAFACFERLKSEKGAEADPSVLEEAHGSIGSIYYQKKAYEAAIYHYQKAIDYAMLQGNGESAASWKKDITAVRWEMNQEAK